ncbi:MAG: hypothetical protein ACLUAR_16965 [Pilosibacter sp.]
MDGTFQFEGLYLDNYVDRKIRFLARDDEILKVETMVSDEIVYENAWISGFSGRICDRLYQEISRRISGKG